LKIYGVNGETRFKDLSPEAFGRRNSIKSSRAGSRVKVKKILLKC